MKSTSSLKEPSSIQMKGKRKGIKTIVARIKSNALRNAGLCRARRSGAALGIYHDVLLARMSMRLAPRTKAKITTEIEEPYPTR